MLKVRGLQAFDPKHGEARNFSLALENGEICCLIGPASSGKLVVSRAIAGAISSSHGETVINHFKLQSEPAKAKSQLGYVPYTVQLPPYLTGFEYLELIASAFQMPPKTRLETIRALADHFNAHERLYTPIEHLSLHTKQLISYLAAVMHAPKVIVVEEPTQHLDPTASRRMVEDLKERAKEGASILVVTDNLALAESLGQTFMAMDRGEVVLGGSLKQMANQIRAKSAHLSDIYQQIFG